MVLSKNIILAKKGACGNGPAGGKWFWSKMSFLTKKKAPAASRQAEENGLFPQETLFWGEKKAPAAIGQSEGKNVGQNFQKKYVFFKFCPGPGG